MATDVIKDSTPRITFVPSTIWTRPTAAVVAPDGTSAATPTATLDSVSTTLATVTNAFTMTLTSAASVEAGKSYEITDAAFGSVIAQVGSLDGVAIVLTDPLPAVPTAGATFKGVEIDVSVPAAQTATLGMNWRVVIEDIYGRQLSHWFNVVRQVFPAAIGEAGVRRLIAHGYTSSGILRQPELLRDIAAEASQMVRDRLRELTSWPSLVGDPACLDEVGRVAARVVLFNDFALVPPGRDPEEYSSFIHDEFQRRCAGLVHRLGGYDTDDDGDFEEEATNLITSVIEGVI